MKIVFFTGAGISRESGLKTFRDDDGLWEGVDVQEDCSARAWKESPGRVLAFYNERRRAVREAEPNQAHYAIASLENSEHQVTVITQNVDDLHERAGSRNVIHLHGEIMKCRSDADETTLYDCAGDISLGDLAPDGAQMRPHVVLFGETLYNYNNAKSASKTARILVVVGTSLAVYPAAYLVSMSGANVVYVVDPKIPALSRLGIYNRKVIAVKKTATQGVAEAIGRIQIAIQG